MSMQFVTLKVDGNVYELEADTDCEECYDPVYYLNEEVIKEDEVPEKIREKLEELAIEAYYNDEPEPDEGER